MRMIIQKQTKITVDLQKCSISSPRDFDLIGSVSLGNPGVLESCHLPTAEHLPACLGYHGTIVYAVALVCGKHLPSSLLGHLSCITQGKGVFLFPYHLESIDMHAQCTKVLEANFGKG